MIFSALIVLLGESLAEVIVELGLKKAIRKVLPKKGNSPQDQLVKQLKKGDFEIIQRALVGACEDILKQYATEEERNHIAQLLDAFVDSKSSPSLKALSAQITHKYLLGNPDSASTVALTKEIHQAIVPAKNAEGVGYDENTQVELLHRFFIAYRERLLQEPALAFAREYFQLIETRKQTNLQEAMLERLDTIADNMVRPFEDVTAARQEYRDYLVKEFKDHVIRGFAPQVGGRVISLPLAKIFLPLQAIEGRRRSLNTLMMISGDRPLAR
ncbi:MAG: hypothetical protein ACREOI_13720 [bacterium]